MRFLYIIGFRLISPLFNLVVVSKCRLFPLSSNSIDLAGMGAATLQCLDLHTAYCSGHATGRSAVCCIISMGSGQHYRWVDLESFTLGLTVYDSDAGWSIPGV